jgi:hypothetical protein
VREQSRRESLGIVDCVKCMETNGKQARQSLGCGYEPRDESIAVVPWEPPRGEAGYQGDPPEWCAGYTTKLPEVGEVEVMRVHWSKGAMSVALCGEAPNEDLLNAILICEGAHNEVQNWTMTPAKDGGGGS